MTKQTRAFVTSLALCGGIAFFAGGAACSSSDNKSDGGSGGAGGNAGGSGGAGGAVATQVTVQLSGAAEVPANTSPGTGTATVTWDIATRMVSVTGTFDGLSSNATMAHLHGPADPTANAGVIFALTVPTPAAASGTVTGSGTLSAGNWAEFLAGRTYLNIHTTVNPTGELRGQVVP